MNKLYYAMIICSVIFSFSFFYSMVQYNDFRLIDLAATIVFVWNASMVKKKMKEQTA